MKLFYHTDRAEGLQPGQIIEREPYMNESLLAVFSPFMDDGFLAHLSSLQRGGLSLHGARYMIQLDGDVHFPSFATELVYEQARWKKHPGKPSRFQPLFGWLKAEDAIAMAKGHGRGRVYELSCEEAAFVGDMNALKLSFDPEEQARNTDRYWRGKPLSSDVGYTPRWECLLLLPVKVVREVLVNPVDGKPVLG